MTMRGDMSDRAGPEGQVLKASRWSTSAVGLAAGLTLVAAFALGLLTRPVVADGGGLGQGEVPTTTPVLLGPARGGSPVYPEQDIPLRFNHGQHLALKIDCVRCHTKIRGSTQTADFNFPTGASCDGCHGAQHPRPAGEPARCDLCLSLIHISEPTRPY